MFHGPAFSADPKPLKVGVRGGVDEQIWEVVARVAKKNGLAVEPVVITGTASPNEALNNGDLEANSFQHIPFLKDQIKQRGYKLVPVANTLISPIAFYSKKYKSLQDLPPGAKVGIPNDPSNQTRALVVLRDQGLITLKDGFDPFTGTATLADVTSNPRKLEFVESASVVLARSLPDVDTAAIVNSFAYQAGLIATRDGIAGEEGKQSLRQHHRGARAGQECALGAGAGQGLPFRGSAPVHSEQVRRFGHSGVLTPAGAIHHEALRTSLAEPLAGAAPASAPEAARDREHIVFDSLQKRYQGPQGPVAALSDVSFPSCAARSSASSAAAARASPPCCAPSTCWSAPAPAAC